MKLIPAIDLMNGKCVRLFKGDFNKRKDFSREPYEQAKYWEKEGAKCIHIVDLDAAKTGSPEPYYKSTIKAEDMKAL